MTISLVLGQNEKRRQISRLNAIRDILYCCLVTLVVVDCHVIRSERSTSHIPRGLNSPCAPNDAPTVMTTRSLQRNNVLPKIEEALDITVQLREEMGMIQLPEAYSEEILGLPGPGNISTDRNLTVDYIALSRLLVFVDIVYTDPGTPHEIVHQSRRALWRELRVPILSLLCDMYRRISNTPYISMDIARPCDRNASCSGRRSRFTRDQRNFFIASSARDVLSRLHQTYSVLPVQ